MLHEFTYKAPATLDELFTFLDEHGDESSLLAGGTDLLVNIRSDLVKPTYVVDIKRIDELKGIHFDEKEGLSIGARVTVDQLVQDENVRSRYPLLATAGEQHADHQLRRRATVIGNLVTASPCGDMASPMLVLGAEVVIRSSAGQKRMPLAEFITGVKKTVLGKNEIVEKLIVPAKFQGARGGYEKLKRIKGHDLGLVAVAMARFDNTMRFAVSSAAPTPVLLTDFAPDASFEEVHEAAKKAISPIDDVRSTKDYREHMVGVYLKKLLEEVK
jgi:carbon-monoxide dehydrogenase medium subunit